MLVAPWDRPASWGPGLCAPNSLRVPERCERLRAPRGAIPAPSRAGAECGAPAPVSAGLRFLQWGTGRAGLGHRGCSGVPGPAVGERGAAPPLSPEPGRRWADGPPAPGAASRVRVFFGKLHLFSSLVWASPERGRMSHHGAHDRVFGEPGKGPTAGTPRGARAPPAFVGKSEEAIRGS